MVINQMGALHECFPLIQTPNFCVLLSRFILSFIYLSTLENKKCSYLNVMFYHYAQYLFAMHRCELTLVRPTCIVDIDCFNERRRLLLQIMQLKQLCW